MNRVLKLLVSASIRIAQVLKQFLELARLPWATVTNNQFAEQCGADMLPFTVLLDRSGKVTDIFVQGSALPRTLETLFDAAGAVETFRSLTACPSPCPTQEINRAASGDAARSIAADVNNLDVCERWFSPPSLATIPHISIAEMQSHR